jgi:hypothetical protein
MPDMADLLAELSRPRLTWISATVSAVDVNGLVTLDYKGGTIFKASHLSSYVPVPGDRVEALSYEPMGVLVLGKNAAPASPPPSFLPQTPVIVSPSTVATYGPGLTDWAPGTLEQGPGKVACLFYPAAFSSLAGKFLQTVEVELIVNSGGPPDFIGHQNDTPAGALVTTGLPFRSTTYAPGTSVWFPLSIGIGQALVSGAIRGIGIVSNGQTGSYSGSGRVRLTPLDVTI